MPPFDTLLPFLGIAVLLSLAPGPDNIFVLLLSAMHGTRAGLTVVLGLCTGLLVHTAVVAVGLAALLAASTVAFTVLKIAGALYLVYLAWQAFRAPVGELSSSQMQVKTGKHMYLRGVIMNLTNPKVVIFFLAFLPQFVSPDRGPVAPQIMVLGFVFILATLLVFGSIAWFSGAFGRVLMRSARMQRAVNWFAGSVFLALAGRLALSQR
ncbi:threonine/homoserine/homoserine lactone efflux protein [Cupriavidus metallidurans]|mgnify:FL=1|jgi:threonine/homoserine/homoserine lactone efflux protein|uniref:Amino acid (Threonine) efflux protein n=1 Tax=Cupriavidus metallidurans (strain ATCC 43123 / DSM 2839 / NBRC 102507 / CH34) TaxID=266264 RepID=Q1LGE7_CUPMC|nr:LysE family translocator [Cupriavidus metallidurans]ABF10779.1 putative amino acid (threonine) efflux protein [Cupriavidus metallidurans CH34]AVA35025.1 LysE family translocator [Cupriavidus metallidurans]KWW34164.1 Homoserine/homoserine lactone efflux protein [Cupriavidus metallidurans]MDE4921391.1 LysE family translocator [Cupriavidus metallidurans]QGS31761.1 LysE family translocator [Cupriavidus metallidurans]